MNPVTCCQLFDEAGDFKKQISTMFVIIILQIVVRFVNLLRFKSRKKVYINQKTGDLPPHHKKRNRPYCWASMACEITAQNSQAFIFSLFGDTGGGCFPFKFLGSTKSLMGYKVGYLQKENHPKPLVSGGFSMVPVAGVEPARGCPQRILSPSRLPIPTHRHLCC